MSLITKLFQFVLMTTNKHQIDESHGLSHSMNVLHFANNIYEAEKQNFPILEGQAKVIFVSAIIHDMCDKKYIDESEGLYNINSFLEDKMTKEEIDISKKIINTMSYSKVKKMGFPELHEYQMAYHIVREADLLSAYDFDRCMLYNIHNTQNKSGPGEMNVLDAFNNASELFQNRVLKHNVDGLFITEYSKHHYLPLHIEAVKRIQTWKQILRKPML
jgi:HD superfamily phosphodiesterase